MEHAENKRTRRRPAGERVLKTADEMFYEEGIRAVGVDAVVERAGVAKMSLYKNFGSKDGLVSAYLGARDERWRGWLEGEVERRADDPKGKILAVFDAYAEWMGRESPRGCAFINAFAELADPDHPAQGVIREQKEWVRGCLARLAREAGAREPEGLADRLFVLLEGATVADAMGTAGDPWRGARETAAVLVAGL